MQPGERKQETDNDAAATTVETRAQRQTSGRVSKVRETHTHTHSVSSAPGHIWTWLSWFHKKQIICNLKPRPHTHTHTACLTTYPDRQKNPAVSLFGPKSFPEHFVSY